jgi:large subunit ribosomal protein L21
MVGTPTVGGIKVSATVMGHVKGPKVVTFKYRPKKRIRVKSGHRHQFTRLLIDFIGKPGEERKAAKKESPAAVEEAGVEKQAKARKEAAKPSSKEKKPSAKKPTTAKKSTPKPSAKK